MFCKKCGKDIDIKSKVCPECGEDTEFLKGIDGSEKLEHLEDFENEINQAFNSISVEMENEEAEYEDISSYQTPAEERSVEKDSEKAVFSESRRSERRKKDDSYDEDNGSTWKILATVCGVIILVCLIIIISVSCGGGKSSEETQPTTVTTVATTVSTTEPTTQPATEKPVSEYLETAVVDDEVAIETVQGFYSNLEAACAGDDIEAFSQFFAPSYSEEEIQSLYDQYHNQCAEYSTFIPGITNTVSCDKYIYAYVAATTNIETSDYVENTFVLSSDNGAFKLDKSDGANAFMAEAPNKIG